MTNNNTLKIWTNNLDMKKELQKFYLLQNVNF